MYLLSYKYRLGNLQVSVKQFKSIGEEIKVQFIGTKLMYWLSYKYRLSNLQVSVKK